MQEQQHHSSQQAIIESCKKKSTKMLTAKNAKFQTSLDKTNTVMRGQVQLEQSKTSTNQQRLMHNRTSLNMHNSNSTLNKSDLILELTNSDMKLNQTFYAQQQRRNNISDQALKTAYSTKPPNQNLLLQEQYQLNQKKAVIDQHILSPKNDAQERLFFSQKFRNLANEINNSGQVRNRISHGAFMNVLTSQQIIPIMPQTICNLGASKGSNNHNSYMIYATQQANNQSSQNVNKHSKGNRKNQRYNQQSGAVRKQQQSSAGPSESKINSGSIASTLPLQQLQLSSSPKNRNSQSTSNHPKNKPSNQTLDTKFKVRQNERKGKNTTLNGDITQVMVNHKHVQEFSSIEDKNRQKQAKIPTQDQDQVIVQIINSTSLKDVDKVSMEETKMLFGIQNNLNTPEERKSAVVIEKIETKSGVVLANPDLLTQVKLEKEGGLANQGQNQHKCNLIDQVQRKLRIGKELGTAKRLMPIFKEMIGKVAKEVQKDKSRPKSTNKSRKIAQGNKVMQEALGVKRLNSLADRKEEPPKQPRSNNTTVVPQNNLVDTVQEENSTVEGQRESDINNTLTQDGKRPVSSCAAKRSNISLDEKSNLRDSREKRNNSVMLGSLIHYGPSQNIHVSHPLNMLGSSEQNLIDPRKNIDVLQGKRMTIRDMIASKNDPRMISASGKGKRGLLKQRNSQDKIHETDQANATYSTDLQRMINQTPSESNYNKVVLQTDDLLQIQRIKPGGELGCTALSDFANEKIRPRTPKDLAYQQKKTQPMLMYRRTPLAGSINSPLHHRESNKMSSNNDMKSIIVQNQINPGARRDSQNTVNNSSHSNNNIHNPAQNTKRLSSQDKNLSDIQNAYEGTPNSSTKGGGVGVHDLTGKVQANRKIIHSSYSREISRPGSFDNNIGQFQRLATNPDNVKTQVIYTQQTELNQLENDLIEEGLERKTTNQRQKIELKAQQMIKVAKMQHSLNSKSSSSQKGSIEQNNRVLGGSMSQNSCQLEQDQDSDSDHHDDGEVKMQSILPHEITSHRSAISSNNIGDVTIRVKKKNIVNPKGTKLLKSKPWTISQQFDKRTVLNKNNASSPKSISQFEELGTLQSRKLQSNVKQESARQKISVDSQGGEINVNRSKLNIRIKIETQQSPRNNAEAQINLSTFENITDNLSLDLIPKLNNQIAKSISSKDTYKIEEQFLPKTSQNITAPLMTSKNTKLNANPSGSSTLRNQHSILNSIQPTLRGDSQSYHARLQRVVSHRQVVQDWLYNSGAAQIPPILDSNSNNFEQQRINLISQQMQNQQYQLQSYQAASSGFQSSLNGKYVMQGGCDKDEDDQHDGVDMFSYTDGSGVGFQACKSVSGGIQLYDARKGQVTSNHGATTTTNLGIRVSTTPYANNNQDVTSFAGLSSDCLDSPNHDGELVNQIRNLTREYRRMSKDQLKMYQYTAHKSRSTKLADSRKNVNSSSLKERDFQHNKMTQQDENRPSFLKSPTVYKSELNNSMVGAKKETYGTSATEYLKMLQDGYLNTPVNNNRTFYDNQSPFVLYTKDSNMKTSSHVNLGRKTFFQPLLASSAKYSQLSISRKQYVEQNKLPRQQAPSSQNGSQNQKRRKLQKIKISGNNYAAHKNHLLCAKNQLKSRSALGHLTSQNAKVVQQQSLKLNNGKSQKKFIISSHNTMSQLNVVKQKSPTKMAIV